MNQEERARMLDEAIDANEEAIVGIMRRGGDRQEALQEVMGVVFGYCEEHGGPAADEITVRDFHAALGRRAASHRAEGDRTSAGAEDLRRMPAIVGKASFDTEDMTIGEILGEMDRRGELSDEDRRAVEGIMERVPKVEVPEDQ